MKVWLDDLKPAPDGWTWVKSSADALTVLRSLYGTMVDAPGWSNGDRSDSFEAIAFDHDLGGADDSRKVMTWIVEYGFWPADIWFITFNPIGRSWLAGTARRYAPDWVDIHG